MDLVSLIREMWRHKLVVLPVAVLTLAAAAYVAVLRPAEYASAAAVALVNPPQAPTSDQIARNPALAKINANNPYTQYGDLTIVVDLLQQAMQSTAVVDHLKAEGVESGYTLQPSVQASAPILQVSGIGSTPAAAVRAATLIDAEVATTLHALQTVRGVNPNYLITTQVITPPGLAQLQLSSKLRSLIAVLVIGIVLLFVALSFRRAAEERKTEAGKVEGSRGPTLAAIADPIERAPALARPRRAVAQPGVPAPAESPSARPAAAAAAGQRPRAVRPGGPMPSGAPGPRPTPPVRPTGTTKPPRQTPPPRRSVPPAVAEMQRGRGSGSPDEPHGIDSPAT